MSLRASFIGARRDARVDCACAAGTGLRLPAKAYSAGQNATVRAAAPDVPVNFAPEAAPTAETHKKSRGLDPPRVPNRPSGQIAPRSADRPPRAPRRAR